MKYRVFTVVAALCALCALSVCMRPLVRISCAGSQKFSADASLGEGVILAVLGGYRGLLADFAWLKAYGAWERRDAAKCAANIEAAARLDPDILLFWHMGGGIIAYDMPKWIIESRPHTPLQIRHVREKQARMALEFLDRGVKQLPHTRRLWLDKALLFQRVLKDPKAELDAYAHAAKGDAPLFIMRDYANRLEDAGRLEDALAVLKRADEKADKSHSSYPHLRKHIEDIENKLRAQKK